jgi:nicotinate-nucleotide pyrophosphorylase (carboxylating)
MTELFPTGKPHLLNELSVDRLIDQWLAEDIPSFDYGGTYLLQINRQTIVKGFVVGYKRNQAHLFCKSAGVLAGVPFVNRIFQRLQCSIEWQIEEGTITYLCEQT